MTLRTSCNKKATRYNKLEMTKAYTIHNQSATYFVTMQVVNWVDIFTRKEYRDIVIKNLDYCIKNKGLEIFAYVIMYNHIHLIVRTKNHNLSGILRDFKGYTTKQIVKHFSTNTESRRKWLSEIFQEEASRNSRNIKYQIWTHENHCVEVFSNDFFDQKREYIHNNPVKAGIVEKPEDYLYSSARNYAEKENNLLNIIVDKY